MIMGMRVAVPSTLRLNMAPPCESSGMVPRGPSLQLASGVWRVRRRRQADAFQQIRETGIVAQIVHARIYMKVNEPVAVLRVGFLQKFNRAVMLGQAEVDSSKKMRRDIFVLGQFR